MSVCGDINTLLADSTHTPTAILNQRLLWANPHGRIECKCGTTAETTQPWVRFRTASATHTHTQIEHHL